MRGCALSLAPINFLCISRLCSAYPSPIRFLYLRPPSSPLLYPLPLLSIRLRNPQKKTRFHRLAVKAKQRESPYEVLGVSPSATPDEIKKAYRKMALKFHPDVNREANAQEKFMRIKHAYNTLLNSDSRRRYESGKGTSDYSSWTGGRNKSRSAQEEDFYGFEDFFKDLQEEYRNWEAGAASQGKPKSLWEELSEIGEEFVEFLEKELNINDEETTSKENERNAFQAKGADRSTSDSRRSEAANRSSVDDNIDEIEATLAELKRQLGL